MKKTVKRNAAEIKIYPVLERPLIEEVREFFIEYLHSLNVDLSFQNIDEELDNLPGNYAPPKGCLLIARLGDQPAGCVALRPIDEQTCEMKRLYVRPACRGWGIGHLLVMTLMEKAKALGYALMRLDTLPTMGEAQDLYRSFGFYEIEAYVYNPIPGTQYMERKL